MALVREPENQYDANAIQCVIDGIPCGYIPKDQAVRLAADIDAGKAVTATLALETQLHIEVEDPAEEPPV